MSLSRQASSPADAPPAYPCPSPGLHLSMQELNNELEPVKAAKKDAQEAVAKLEALQVCGRCVGRVGDVWGSFGIRSGVLQL